MSTPPRELESLPHRQIRLGCADVAKPEGSLKHCQRRVALAGADVCLRKPITRLSELRVALDGVAEHDQCSLVVVLCHVDPGEAKPLLNSVRAEINRLVERTDCLLAISWRAVELRCLHQQSCFVG